MMDFSDTHQSDILPLLAPVIITYLAKKKYVNLDDLLNSTGTSLSHSNQLHKLDMTYFCNTQPVSNVPFNPPSNAEVVWAFIQVELIRFHIYLK